MALPKIIEILGNKEEKGHSHVVSDLTDNKIFSLKVTGTTGTTGFWTASHPEISAYTDGLTIALFTNAYSGTGSGTRLNINGLGDKRIYYNDNSSLTTHYGNETLIMLYFDAAQDRFYCHDFYYSSEDYNLRWENDVKAGTYIHGYQLLMEGADGKFYPVTEGGSTANTNDVSTAEMRVGGKILVYNSSTDYAADATITTNYLWESEYCGYMEYWNNRDSGWASAGFPVYLVGTINANNNFVLDNSSYTSFLTQNLPTSDDGKVYIKIGFMHNTYDTWRLQTDHPIYEYKNNEIRLYVPDHTHNYQPAGTYNTQIGTDTDLNTDNAEVVDQINVTDGVITSMSKRTLTLGNLGFTGATNANYITNNNQLTNGAGYVTTNTQLSNEQVQDIVGAMFTNNTETRITATYQDADGTIDLVVNDMYDNVDTNTTYTIAASTGTGGADLDLTAGGSGSGTDTVTFKGSGATTVTYTDANTITISSVDTNTDTIYTHPDYTETDIDTSGAEVIDTITVVNGHINGHTKRTLTPANIGAAPTNHNHSGNTEFHATDESGTYNTAAIEIREVNHVSTLTTEDAYAPSLAFHWGGRVQGALALRASGDLVWRTSVNAGNILWHAGNFNPANYLGASAKAADSNLLDGLNYSDFTRGIVKNGYHGLQAGDGSDANWIRTTVNGIIPYQSGGASSLGTSSWPFTNIYATNIYDGGTLLESKYAALSHDHSEYLESGGSISWFKVTNEVEFPTNGTLSDVTITATGDTNTGINFKGSGGMQFVSDAVEICLVESSGLRIKGGEYYGKKTISTSTPSSGSDGDIWYRTTT